MSETNGTDAQVKELRDEFNGRIADLFERIEKMFEKQEGKLDILTSKFETLARIEANQIEHAKGLERAFSEIANIKAMASQHDRDDDHQHGVIFNRLDQFRKEAREELVASVAELVRKQTELSRDSETKHTASKTKQDQLDGAISMGKVVWSVVTVLVVGFVGMIFAFQQKTTDDVHKIETDIQVHREHHKQEEAAKNSPIKVGP